ncbi:MAG: hypothetical protein HOW97_39645 [Catenulispora sp.]|nr:hypothetical protein [Catenulispora sp.]NUS29143.1 hypothetical protein [Streptomyces sp.]
MTSTFDRIEAEERIVAIARERSATDKEARLRRAIDSYRNAVLREAGVMAVVQPELDRRDAEIDRLRIAAQAAATLLRSTADKVAAGRRLDLDTLRHAATALDDAARATTS